MTELLDFLLLGLEGSALAAGFAQALVITFRSSGVINFAAGGTAMFVAYIFYGLHGTGALLGIPITGSPMGSAAAFAISVVLAAVVGLLQYVFVYRLLRNTSVVAKVVASAGLLLLLVAIPTLIYGANSYPNPELLPAGSAHILGAVVPADRLWLTAIVLFTGATLWAVYRFTMFGVATRAAEDSRKGALLLGARADRLECANWVLASVLLGVVGILGSAVESVSVTGFTDVLVPALAAGLLGGLSSFGIVTAGAFGIGVLQALITYAETKSWFPKSGGQPLPGVPDAVPFVIITVILFRAGRGLSERLTPPSPRLPRAFRPTTVWPRFLLGTIVAVGMLALLSFGWRQALINSMIGSLLCLSFVVLTGYAGQLSFAQITLTGVSGFMVSHLVEVWGVPFPIAPVIAILTAMAISAIVALPALRLRGLQLAVVTLAGAVAVQSLWFNNPDWGGGFSPNAIRNPSLFGIGLGPQSSFWNGDGAAPSPGFGLVVLVGLLLGAWIVVNLRRSASGGRMLAVRSDESAAAAAGVNVALTKLQAFVIAGFLAGFAGVLSGYNGSGVTATSFDVITAISFFAVAYLGGITTVTGAILAGLLVSQGVSVHLLSSAVGIPGNYQPLLAAIGVLATVTGNPDGIAGFMHRKWENFVEGRRFIPGALQLRREGAP
jgi:branched-chain amino acid transport system permease protein